MLKSSFRDRFEYVHVGIGMFFARLGITPNAWTALSLLPAIVGFLCLYSQMLGWGLLFFAISAFTDIIDGNVARVMKSVSSLGAFLDGVVDRYVEFALYLGLYFYMENMPGILFPAGFWIMMLMFGAIMPSFITAYADHRKVITDDKRLRSIGGLLERFERLMLLYIGMFAGIYNPQILSYTVVLTALLANITALQRIYSIMRIK
jgi:archaetidylinositol phosphate synthase